MTIKGSRTKRKTASGGSSEGKARTASNGPSVVDASRPAEAGAGGESAALDIARRARRHTSAALEAFVAVMQDDSAPAAARVAAATQILNWGHGKNAGGESENAPKTVRLAWEA